MKKIHKITSALLGLALLAGCAQAEPNKNPTTLSSEAQEGVPAGWITDYNAALKQAKAEGKAVLIDFTGSDWCGWCIKLDDEILSKQAFKDYAEKNLILVYADFPKGKPQSEELKAQNEKLAKQFGVRGFPTLIVLNSNGQKVGQMGYMRGGPDPFLKQLKEVTKS